MDKNPVGWFEIPVSDMERATKFYEAVFKVKLDHHDMEDLKMAWFPMVDNAYGAAGTLVHHAMYKPSQDGCLIYFSSHTDNLEDEMSRVEEAGGKILEAKKSIGEHGFMGLFLDTEGNRIAVHSMK